LPDLAWIPATRLIRLADSVDDDTRRVYRGPRIIESGERWGIEARQARASDQTQLLNWPPFPVRKRRLPLANRYGTPSMIAEETTTLDRPNIRSTSLSDWRR